MERLTDADRLAAIRREWTAPDCCSNYQDDGYEEHRCEKCGFSETMHDVGLLLEALDAALAARQQAEQEREEHWKALETAGAVIAVHHGEVTALRAALEQYGKHRASCPTNWKEACSCGFDAALAGSRAQEE